MKTVLSQVSIQAQAGDWEKAACDVLVFPVFQQSNLLPLTRQVDKLLKGSIQNMLRRKWFDPEKDKTFWIESSATKSPWILLVSLGLKQEFSRDALRNSYGAAAKEIFRKRLTRVGVLLPKETKLRKEFDAAIEGFLLATYRFEKHKKSASKEGIKSVSVFLEKQKDVSVWTRELNRLKAVVNGTFLARDWINEPANVANPSFMAKQAQAIAKSQGLSCKVLSEAELKKKGMNLILAVGTGSVERPRMVHLEYRPKKKSKRKVAFVGKGVTFDSGGLSLKSQSHMYGMKCDMSGAAAVLGAMWAVGELKPSAHVHALIPLVENLPSHNSVKPGDVVKAFNGKSVEIENTDAEGRLILADAISYADGLGVNEILDVATLTGACVVALGEDISGILSTHQKLVDRFQKAGKITGEKFWQLPLEKSYTRLLKSDVADLKNVGGRYGGTIIAALFLSEFVSKTPWAHLDIAGPAFIEREWPISSKGGTGFAVRTFLEFLNSS